jgi:Tol biopolymer transport system component
MRSFMFLDKPARQFYLMLFALLISLLAGCQLAAGPSVPVSAIALTPSTTPDNQGYYAVPAPACVIAEWSSMQTDRLQGDLIAWSQDSSRLAYLAPQPNSSWYVGLVGQAQGKDLSQRAILVPNIMAIGDLNWSPDGTMLAFVALRTNEAVETVMVARTDGSGLTDLFPFDEARSDQRTSQKAIKGWTDANHILVLTSCAEDCQQETEVNVLTGTISQNAESERRNAMKTPTPGVVKVLDGLEPEVNLQSYDAKVYPRGFSRPNWSPDGKFVLYLDRRGLLWHLDPASKAQYLMDLGLRDVDETKWSPDGQRVAVRAEDRIFIFDLACNGSPLP